MPLPTRAASIREPKPGQRPAISSRANTSSDSSSKIATLKSRSTVSPAESRDLTSAPEQLRPSQQQTAGGLPRLIQSPRSALPQRGHVRSESASKIATSNLHGALHDASSRSTLAMRSRGQSVTDSAPVMPRPRPALSATRSTPAAALPEPQNKIGTMGPPPRPTRSASLRQPVKPSAPATEPPKGHVRHRSQGTNLIAARTVPKLAPEVTAKTTLKPQFSTLQQHYSPKRAPRPPQPPSAEAIQADNLLRSETSHLQNELLQLILLRENALLTQEEWKLSAQQALETRFNQVLSQYKFMANAAQDAQRQINHKALNTWVDGTTEDQFLQDIETISRAVQQLSDLTSGGGRFTQIVVEFETWAAQVQLQEEDTMQGVYDEDKEAVPLGRAWTEQVFILEGELDLCRRELRKMPAIDDTSGLGRLLKGHRTLLDNVLEEVHTFKSIKARIEARETRRMERVLKTLLGDASRKDLAGLAGTQKPVWQSS